MQVSDELLIAKVARGDQTALEILYERHAATVLGILTQTISERTVAEETLQETFWRVWQLASTYDSQRVSFTAWLYGIVGALAIHRLARSGL